MGLFDSTKRAGIESAKASIKRKEAKANTPPRSIKTMARDVYKNMDEKQKSEFRKHSIFAKMWDDEERK